MRKFLTVLIVALVSVSMFVTPVLADQDRDEPAPEPVFAPFLQIDDTGLVPSSCQESLPVILNVIEENDLWDLFNIEYASPYDPIHEIAHSMMGEESINHGCHVIHVFKKWRCTADSGPPDFFCTNWQEYLLVINHHCYEGGPNSVGKME